ncbi:MAG: PEP-CTERM sorting domain-containing protein [Gemmatimonadaceae bacterium]|nr:PEP-CTERM sorting domain-containing protein [Gemmatimonadaceae bacterium]
MSMHRIAYVPLVLASVVAALAAHPADAAAQAKPGPQKSTTVTVGGTGRQVITVSVLGALRAVNGTQLYYFPDPFDPLTGQFSPNRKVAIGPAASLPTRSQWVAPQNSTVIGTFLPGQTLVFGLELPGNVWYYSGAVNVANATGLSAVNGSIASIFSGSWVNGAVTGAGTTVYNWNTIQGTRSPVEGLQFVTTQAVATPEPATLSLIGLGLAGLGGVGLRRRRKSS